MKIIVTGALGHIGSRLVRELPLYFPGSEIVMIDNMMTQRFASLFDLPSVGRYRFIEADVTAFDLSSELKDSHAVIHLAAITDAAGSVDRAEMVEANNFIATRNVATLCARHDVRLLTLSSTSVYGSQRDVVSEDCSPEDLAPQSPYATTKLSEEALVAELCDGTGLKAVVCRFGTIFGASRGMRFHTAVNKFCWQASLRQPLTVWRTAYDQKRPYLDIADATRAIAFILQNDMFDGRIYNVLTLNATVRHIVETIREFVSDLDVTFVDSRIMNQLSYEVSCERFISCGFSFTGDLRRGIGETLSMLHNANAGSRAAR